MALDIKQACDPKELLSYIQKVEKLDINERNYKQFIREDLRSDFPSLPSPLERLFAARAQLFVTEGLRKELFRQATVLRSVAPTLPPVPSFSDDPEADITVALRQWCVDAVASQSLQELAPLVSGQTETKLGAAQIEIQTDAILWEDALWVALEQAKTCLIDDPQILHDKKPTLESGLNIDLINNLARKAGLTTGFVIEPSSECENEQEVARRLTFHHPDPPLPIEVTTWHRVWPKPIPQAKIDRIVAYVGAWQQRRAEQLQPRASSGGGGAPDSKDAAVIEPKVPRKRITAEQRAVASYEWICREQPTLTPKAPKRYGREQWQYLCDHSCPAYEDDDGNSLQIPCFETWKRQIRKGRQDQDAPKTSPRTGREHGRSITPLTQI